LATKNQELRTKNGVAMKTAALFVLAIHLALVGQASDAAGQAAMSAGLLQDAAKYFSMSWISNISGIGLTALLVLNIIPSIVRRQCDALEKLSTAITDLRVHCAAKTGEATPDAARPTPPQLPVADPPKLSVAAVDHFLRAAAV
jgi:hypothetical protein